MKKLIFYSIILLSAIIQSHATTLITNVVQVEGTYNLQVDWGETDVNLNDPGTSLHHFKLIYKMQGNSAIIIDNISSGTRNYTISNLSSGTYEVELIEIIRVQVPPTPFSLPYVDTENSSGIRTANINSLNSAPIAKCSDRTLSVGNGATVNFLGYQAGEGSTDPNNDPLTYTLYPEGPYGIGNHFIELTVSDPAGLSSKCYFTLSVIDNTPPVVLAKNAVIFIKENGYAELNIEDVDDRSYDNASWVDKTISKRYFICENVGFNSVTLTVTDESGNTNSKAVTVQVVDNTEPYITKEKMELYADSNGRVIINQALLDTLVYDYCGIKQIVTSKDTFSLEMPNDTLGIIATDIHGNVSAKKIIVTVLDSTLKAKGKKVNEEAILNVYSSQDSSFKPKRENKLEIENLDDKVNFGPNPTNGIVNFQIPNNYNKVNLFQANGKEIPIDILNHNGAFQLNLQDFQNGLYILKLQSLTTHKIIKLIKN